MTHPSGQNDGIIIGDCIEKMRLLEDLSIDHVITDPPYSNTTHSKSRRGLTNYRERKGAAARKARTRDLGFAAITDEQRAACAVEFKRLVRRWVLVYTDDRGLCSWIRAIAASGLEWVRTGAWRKLGATPQLTGDRPATSLEFVVIAHQTKPDGKPMKKRWNGGGRHAFWEVPIVLDRGHNGARVHTTQKPLALMEAQIRDFTDEGEWVLDPFCGSGTTLVAARKNGRHGLGIEVDPHYAEIARSRISSTFEQRTFPFA